MKNRLKTNKFFFSVVVILLLFSGCTKDYMVDMVTQKGFEVQLNISNNSVVDTRSVANSKESHIREGYVFVFNPTSGSQVSSYKLDVAKNIKDNGTKNPKITAPVNLSKSDRVIFVFNVALSGNIKEVTYTNIDSYFPLSSQVLSYNNNTNGLPMYGELIWGNINNSVDCIRAVAKIQVQLPVTSSNPNGGLLPENDVTGLFNTSTVSYILYNFTDKGSIISGKFRSAVKTPYSYVPLSKVGDNETGINYMYEFPYSKNIVLSSATPILNTKSDPRRLAIIVKQTTTTYGTRYYRLDLCNQQIDGSLDYLDIKRNFHYKVNITKVSNFGYATIEEALENPASNIEYEIIDNNGDSTVGNNYYAISAEDVLDGLDELIYRSDNDVVRILFSKLKYITHDGAELSNPPATKITHKITQDSGSNLSVDPNNEPITINSKIMTLVIKGNGVGVINTTIEFGDLIIRRVFKVDKNTELNAYGSIFLVNGQIDVAIDGGSKGISIDNFNTEKISITVPENVTPVSWKAMDDSGNYSPVANGDNVDAIPNFGNRYYGDFTITRSGRYVGKTRILIDQAIPIYIGRYGSPLPATNYTPTGNYKQITTATMGDPLRKRAIINRVSNNIRMAFGEPTQHFEVLNEINDGLSITKELYRDHKTETPAPTYCYMKNDLNGDGVVDPLTEPGNWYLPATQQLAGAWSVLHSVGYNGKQAFGSDFYWTATEYTALSSWFVLFDNGNVLNDNHKTHEYIIRCVRDL